MTIIGEGHFIGTSYRHYNPGRAIGCLIFTGRPSDTEICTINGRKYELDTNGAAASAGDVLVDITGNANVDDDITDLAAAINADASASVYAYADTANDVLFVWAKVHGADGNAITLTEGFTNCTASAATLTEGRVGGTETRHVFRHTVTSDEATAGKLRFIIPGMKQVISWNLRIEDAGVVDDTIDTTVAITQPNILILTEGSGPAWAAGDVVILEVLGID
jgi:hypothetical protein